MRPRSWLFVALFALATTLSAAPACRAAESQMDAATAERLRALDGLADELHRTAPDFLASERAGRGSRVNEAFVALTGEAINPLFGVTVLGMYNYFRTDEGLRDFLPVYDQPAVWIPLLAIILLMLFNSTICEAAPFLKTPLNALGDIVNKAGAVAVLPLVVKMFADSVATSAGGALQQTAMTVFPAAYAAEGGVAGAAWYSLGWAAGAVVGTLVYLAVWMAFNVVDVLILICPFPGVDALLKSFRLSIIGILAGSSQLSPILSFLLAAVVVVASLFVAGWSFRLSVFGFVFSTDILLFRRRRAADGPVSAFSSGCLKEEKGVPMRTLGRLELNDAGKLVFSYRPWLFLGRRQVELGARGDFSAGMGLFNPFLVKDTRPDAPWLRLPPRYRGGEEDLARAFKLRRVVKCGMSGSLRAWVAGNLGRETSCPEAA